MKRGTWLDAWQSRMTSTEVPRNWTDGTHCYHPKLGAGLKTGVTRALDRASVLLLVVGGQCRSLRADMDKLLRDVTFGGMNDGRHLAVQVSPPTARKGA